MRVTTGEEPRASRHAPAREQSAPFKACAALFYCVRAVRICASMSPHEFFEIRPTVAETSQPKRARPGKRKRHSILERGGFQMKKAIFSESRSASSRWAWGRRRHSLPICGRRHMRRHRPRPTPGPAATSAAGGGYSTGRSTQYTAPGAVVTPVAPGFRPGGRPGPASTSRTSSTSPASSALASSVATGSGGAWVFGVEGDGSATNKEGQAFENLPRAVPWCGAGALGLLKPRSVGLLPRAAGSA